MPSRSKATPRAASADVLNAPVSQSGNRSTPERILDAAEEMFALHGYYGPSIRDIMGVCGVEFSLARYHFGSKDALFREAIGRRAAAISQEVVASLDVLLTTLGNAEPTVAAIVHALSAPAFEHLASGDRGWYNYLRLLTQMLCLSERPDLTKPFYDQYTPVAVRYREALARALPGTDEETVAMAQSFIDNTFHFVLNSLYAQTSKNLTAARLEQYLDGMRTHLIQLTVGGVKMLVQPVTGAGLPEEKNLRRRSRS